jgi:hypothetical protein
MRGVPSRRSISAFVWCATGPARSKCPSLRAEPSPPGRGGRERGLCRPAPETRDARARAGAFWDHVVFSEREIRGVARPGAVNRGSHAGRPARRTGSATPGVRRRRVQVVADLGGGAPVAAHPRCAGWLSPVRRSAGHLNYIPSEDTMPGAVPVVPRPRRPRADSAAARLVRVPWALACGRVRLERVPAGIRRAIRRPAEGWPAIWSTRDARVRCASCRPHRREPLSASVPGMVHRGSYPVGFPGTGGRGLPRRRIDPRCAGSAAGSKKNRRHVDSPRSCPAAPEFGVSHSGWPPDLESGHPRLPVRTRDARGRWAPVAPPHCGAAWP